MMIIIMRTKMKKMMSKKRNPRKRKNKILLG
jgi:hypothetical protein